MSTVNQSIFLDRKVFYTVILISFIVVIAVLKLTPFGAASTTDSFTYIEAAENFKQGKGVILDSYAMGQEGEAVPFTTWPPLYPMVIAAFLADNTLPFYSVAQLSLLLLLISVLSFFFLIKKVAGYPLAIIGATVFLTASSTVLIFTYAWSETLFTALLILACWSLVYCIEAAQKEAVLAHLGYLCLLTLCVLGLFYTRYAGLWLGVLIPATWLVLPNKGKWFTAYFVASVVYAGFVGYLLWRNYLLVGDISGGEFNSEYNEPLRIAIRPISTTSFLDRVIEMQNALLALLPVNTSIIFLVLLFCLAGMSAFLTWRFSTVSLINNEAVAYYGKKLIFISFLGIVSYIGGFIYMGLVKSLPTYELRYIGLLTPLFVIILLFSLAYACQAQNRVIGMITTGLVSFLMISMIFQGGIYYKNAIVHWNTQPLMLYPTDVTEKDYFFNGTLPLEINSHYKLLQQISKQSVDSPLFFVERPRFIRLSAIYPAVKLFPIEINDYTINQLNHYTDKSAYILLFAQTEIQKLEKYYGTEKFIQLPYNKDYFEKIGVFLLPLPLPLR
ncbi:hypothetical protein [Beggiatoa leptomitoformis]|uniref:Glycosyltransferase RgtA/B/C/D-like domain-containing protein n=1 Tax=Beggiatoa leptomitoformis TaxID=288004 RepID=A0A2N9YFE7_9GAMM|nr:hypothetical protein [Beggiatoa leptomitoformis]ALG68420.1 hypothetical protein AL038_12800 [Beggiatoa leptomitoformis]AUI69251.1 hypothetical protein BLE401_11470 [Beggiatoa leptomitoformis]